MSSSFKNISDIEAALAYISPDIGRDEWIKVGMALHQELGGAGFDIWESWSKSGKKYDSRAIRADWKSFKSTDDGVTIATLFRMAKDGGYCGTNKKPASAPARAKNADGDRVGKPERLAKIEAAKEKAIAIYRKTSKCSSHQYTTNKGITPIGVRQHRQNLLVPMYDIDRHLCSLQIITPDGKKRFLKDCPVTDLYHVIGKLTNESIIIVEGYATAVSVHMATGKCVAIAFSKGNLPKVAKLLKTNHPDLNIILAPDNDSSGDAPRKARKAARDYGCKVVIPEFPANSEGSDWNDLHQAIGLEEVARQLRAEQPVTLNDFRAHMPDHRYIFIPTRDLWPASSVDSRLDWPKGADGKPMRPSRWLDQNAPVEQMTWAPGLPMLIENKLIDTGGWIDRLGCMCFNQYRPPTLKHGDPHRAGPWLEHVHRVYPDDADHIIMWLAHRVQRPGEKINHALVLGGKHGIGKDTLLEPVKHAVGPWNWHEVNPTAMLGRFTGFYKSVILRVSEARDLGDVDRFKLYDHTKTVIAAPPDVLRVDEKNVREYPVPNVCGVVITTNHKSDGLYLPADDRRHFVAWSDLDKDSFEPDYWNDLWRWYYAGGFGNVAAYLAYLNLANFDAKAPPPKTEAFWHIVNAARAPEESELADILEALREPAAVTLNEITSRARIENPDLAVFLTERRSRRQMPHRLEAVGYEPVRNPTAKDRLWKVGGKRQVVYARAELSLRDRLAAAGRLGQ